MQKVTDISVLNIDGKPYAVESLSDEVRSLVAVYNDWNRKEAGVHDELTILQAAKETLSRQIIGKVREHVAAEEEAAKVAEEAAKVAEEATDETVPETEDVPQTDAPQAEYSII